MFDTLKRMKKKDLLTEAMIEKAVRLGWINEAEAAELRA